MADHIPFITSVTTMRLAKTVYRDAEVAHLSLVAAEDLTRPKTLLGSIRLWIDPGVDGLHILASRSTDSGWYKLFQQINGFDRISSPAFGSNPDTKVVAAFVGTILDKCYQH